MKPPSSIPIMKMKNNKSDQIIEYKLAHTRQHSYNLGSNTIDTFTLLSPRVTYDKYIDTVSSSMKDYQLSQTINPKDNSPADKEALLTLTQEDKSLIKKVYQSNHTPLLSQMTSINEDSALKVTIPEINYQSPYHSINILNKNHFIHHNINQNCLERQKVLFTDAIHQFESYTMKHKGKMPKIRVIKLEAKAPSETLTIDITKDDKNRSTLALPVLPLNGPSRLFAYYKYSNKSAPEGREQFTLNLFGSNLILSGGMSSQMKTMSLWKLSLNTVEWEKIPQTNFAHCRFGHTTVCYNGRLYMFGGRTKNERSSMLIGFDIFSLNENAWLSTVGGKAIPPLRRNHVADIIGAQMIINGGVGDNGEILSDCHLLNFNPMKWLACSIDTHSFSPPALFGHTSALVIPKHIMGSPRFNIYKYPDAGLVSSFNSKVSILKA